MKTTPARPTDDYRELARSFGVAQSATCFSCPKCSARSFMVLHGHPLEVECLKCGTVAPYSVSVGFAEDLGEPVVWSENARPRGTIVIAHKR